VFCVPADGRPIVYPDGSPRSELRQLQPADWALGGDSQSRKGERGGVHRLSASLRVTRLSGDATVVIGQIHGDTGSSTPGVGKAYSEWEMLLKLQFEHTGSVCAHVKTPPPIKEIVRRAFPSCTRSILTEICLCHACSCRN
jgi:hypothetical protein